MDFSKSDWLNKVSNLAQIGGIETSVLDNGKGRGVRIAWINTGAGFRFKVVIDRAMDIADAFFNQYNLSWISKLGVTAPQPFADKGADWLRTFSGGLLVTCGLTHVGGPEEDEYGKRGLHDQISNTPAEIINIKQPDPLNGDLEMSITGKMIQGHPLGGLLELTRTIRCTLGKPTIHIDDEIQNIGNVDSPHMLLYHFNFGWPLIDPGTKLLWEGKWEPREQGDDNKIFKEGHDFKTCQAPREDHRGSGEEAAIIKPNCDNEGLSKCGIFNENLGFAVTLAFKNEQLPWLTNWQHWGPGEYVTGLEPGTNPPLGQKLMRERNELIILKPNEKKIYNLSLSILSDPEAIQEFVNNI